MRSMRLKVTTLLVRQGSEWLRVAVQQIAGKLFVKQLSTRQLCTTFCLVFLIAHIGNARQKPQESVEKERATRLPASSDESALIKLKAALEKNPKSDKLNLELARIYLKTKDPNKAISQIKNHFGANFSFDALVLLAEAFEAKKDHLEQIRALELALRKHPSRFQTQTLLARAYFLSSKVDESIKHYRHAIKTSPKYRKAYIGLLEVYESQQNFYETRVLLNDMLKYFPKDGYALSQLCRRLYENGLFPEARAACEDAVTVNAKIAENHVYLGMTLMKISESGRGEKVLKSAASRFPASESAQYEWGSHQQENLAYEKAALAFERALRADPSSQRSKEGLARSLYKSRQFEKASDAYFAACKNNRQLVYELRKLASESRTAGKEELGEKFDSTANKCSALSLPKNNS
ncbi:MAG: hypothetical protein COT74_05470 [Bdellovibrionales bacterium CG10_big_fil_rev_8_21_14_0_10_45_34]|nr:MAG: hypothetical protein COT74_05470 [Bdellovibrionales bacterium CG10_big_fil_rev_8_21_14_0_10_45_34]